MSTDNIVAANIKKLREASEFTQEHMASCLGIGRSAYANYEAGTRDIPLALLEKICDLYGCDLSLVYEEDADMLKDLLVTAFRVNDLSADDMRQIAAFKRVVRDYLNMDRLLAR